VTCLIVSANINSPAVIVTGDNCQTSKEKDTEQNTFLKMITPTWASLKITKDMGTVTARGQMDHFIGDNGRKTRWKDTDSISVQMEMCTMENGKTIKNQEKESTNGLQQA